MSRTRLFHSCSAARRDQARGRASGSGTLCAIERRPRLFTTDQLALLTGPPSITASPDEILAAVDAALYRAKPSGRNRVVVATERARPSRPPPARG